MAKQFTKVEKLEILSYLENHTVLDTAWKYNVNRTTILRWKREYK